MLKESLRADVVALLRQVETFRTVSFAARRLHLSQPMFLARVIELQGRVGLDLVHVDASRRLSLTATASNLLAAASHAEDLMGTAARAPRGPRSTRDPGRDRPAA